MMPYMPMFIPPQAAYSAEFPPLGGPQQGMQGAAMSMGELSPQGGPQMQVGLRICGHLDSSLRKDVGFWVLSGMWAFLTTYRRLNRYW